MTTYTQKMMSMNLHDSSFFTADAAGADAGAHPKSRTTTTGSKAKAAADGGFFTSLAHATLHALNDEKHDSIAPPANAASSSGAASANCSATFRAGPPATQPVPVNEVRNACTLSIEVVGADSTNMDSSDVVFGGGGGGGGGFGTPQQQHVLHRRRSSDLLQGSTLEAEALWTVANVANNNANASNSAEQGATAGAGAGGNSTNVPADAANNKKGGSTGHLVSGPLLAEIRRLLHLAYGSIPDRHVVEDFAIVTTPAPHGCAICILRAAPDHPTREVTALWVAARLLAWSSQYGEAGEEEEEAYEDMLRQLPLDGSSHTSNSPLVNLRCGINSGEVRIVKDVYGDPSVVGVSIDLSCRICDSAQPNQILASSATVVPKLVRSAIGNLVCGIRSLVTTGRRRRSSSLDRGDDDGKEQTCHGDHGGVRYTVDAIPNEIIVGMNQVVTSLVQSITCSVERVKLVGSVSTGDLRQVLLGTPEEEAPRVHVGSTAKPLTKWYMKIKPTELAEDETTGMKSKVPPTDLIQRHVSIAFVGVNHDRLAQVFSRVIDRDETLRWEKVYFLFLADSCIESLHAATEGGGSSAEDMIRKKNKSRIQLEAVLGGRVDDLRFYEYNQPFFCGSFWDVDQRGGFIHVSPLVWGCNPKRCPAINYFWAERVPPADYQLYRDGLNGLLRMARPFDL